MLGNNCLCGKFPVLACLFLPAESPRTLTQFGWWLVWTWNTKTQTCRSWPHSHQILLRWTFQCKGEQNRSFAALGDLLEPGQNKWLRSSIYEKGRVKGETEKEVSVCRLLPIWQDWIYLGCVKVLESIYCFLPRWWPHDLTSINTSFSVHSPESAQMMVKEISGTGWKRCYL